MLPAQQAVAPTPPPTSEVEEVVGELVAHAAHAIAQAALECRRTGRRDGRLAAEWIAQLYTLRQFAFDGIEFDRVARERGRQALRQRCDGKLSERQIGELVDHVLELVEKVTAFARAQLN
jgi:hypothetical protein